MEEIYKLIKQYPGSPRLGAVITDTNPVNGAKDSWFDINWCKPDYPSFKLGKDLHPENYPEFWEKVKEPLFVTEDGKEVFDYSQLVKIVTGEFNIQSVPAESIVSDNVKYKFVFSNLEAAEKWIEQNKPVFSRKQVLEAIDRWENMGFQKANELVLNLKKELGL